METDSKDNVTDEQRLEQVNKFIAQQVRDEFSKLMQQQQQQPDQDSRQQAREVLTSLLADDINPIRITAADAKDEARFYRRYPEAVEYEQLIESTFKKMIEAGRPTSREDLLFYLKGQELYKDRDKFIEKELERRKQQTEKASSAVDMGAFSVARAKEDVEWKDFDKLSLEEMEKKLEGIVF